MEVRRQWDNIFKVLKPKECQPRILSPVKHPSKMRKKIRYYQVFFKLKEFLASIHSSERNTKVSTSGSNERIVDRNSKPYEEIKSTGKSNHTSICENSINIFLFLTLFF